MESFLLMSDWMKGWIRISQGTGPGSEVWDPERDFRSFIKKFRQIPQEGERCGKVASYCG
ncbi:MAG: hypothetical protein CVV32_07455 [Methanomicrobiales archaeon HGW-Methanomicrobiales-3]|nr:MAG: hypothetical protein CVV32_07455 [Methanomicrobiales archaeon HGW-Methanomicrobiales-3]